MWFTPLGSDVGRDNVADLASAALTTEDPNLRPVSTIAPFNRIIVYPISFTPPAPITGTGGAITVDGAFRIHQFTSTGSQVLTFVKI